MNIIQKMNGNKYYNDFTEKYKAILKKFPPSPILAPFVLDIYETAKHFVEINSDRTNTLMGITVITKPGARAKEYEIGGFLTKSEILSHIKTIP